jgi:predicted phosphodiesterase
MINDSHAPLGRLFCDPPAVLTESFMKKIALEEKPDVLIVAGDIIGHKLTQNIS